MQHSFARSAIALATLSVYACDPYVRSTVVQVRDPGAIAVKSADMMSSMAAEPTAIGPVEMTRTEVATGPTSTSDLIVTATRPLGGGIATEWQTRLPLVNGERHTLVDASGKMTLDEHFDVDTSGEVVTIPVCGTLAERTARAVLVGYDVKAAMPCTSPHMTQIDVVMPRSNIESIHHISTDDDRGMAIFGVAMSTVLVGGLGALFTFAQFKNKDGSDPGATPRVIGVGLMSAAVSIDIALLPMVFAPNKDTVVYPASP